jgi:hypothetical protein
LRQTPVPTASLDLDETDPLHSLDDKTLDELLAELGPDDQWKLNPDDPDNIQKLLDEAQNALPRDDEGPALLGKGKDKPTSDDSFQYSSTDRVVVATEMLKLWARDCAQLAYSNPSRRFPVPYAIFMKDEYIQELAQLYAVSGEGTANKEYWDQLSLEGLQSHVPLLQNWKHWDKFGPALLGELKFMPEKIEADLSKRHFKDTTLGDVETGAQIRGHFAKDLDMSAFAVEDEAGRENSTTHSKLEDESQEAQDIVARLLDEVNLERQYESTDAGKTSWTKNEEALDETELSLPSAPSKLPEPSTAEPSRKSIDFESDIAARMAALKGIGASNELGLPSAPTFRPADKPVKTIQKKFTDDEIETWCIICQDDATVKCVGCDGDLYCANCWKEGHMGPDVGFEEKSHKWTKYRKPN